ncbi:MAG: AAA family ATPase, partial [Epsilonproteobacteria bacterium]|nr:AAA family ATPase [Campylobacterota bacterium]
MKKLPIGIQTFKEIREEDYIYIDKTKDAYELITNYKYAFLSRPRRFGKSLFLDTLRNIFEGNKELFNRLYIYDKWEFEKYPVIKISWAGSDYSDTNLLKEKADDNLSYNQEILQIECQKDKNPFSCFRELIQKAYKKYQKKVVVLIDEYDKP